MDDVGNEWGAPFSAESGQFGFEAYICILDILGNVHLGIDRVVCV